MSDGHRTTAQGRLVALGFEARRAQAELERAGLWADDGPADAALVEAAADAASPGDALTVVTELAALRPDQYARIRADAPWLRRVLTVAGVSRSLGDLLARHAEVADALRRPSPLDVDATAGEVADALGGATSMDEGAAQLARIRRRATTVIAARDLTGEAHVDAVTGELAGLAEAVLRGSLRAMRRSVGLPDDVRVAVIGMGKLGGHELNYVSDVDVVFVHDGEDAAAPVRALLERVLTLLNASTTMGRIYEIDPTLRPEGRNGPLSRTLDSYEAYWERWAKTWEFQALIKARFVAGHPGLGGAFLSRAEPFVYPPELDPGVVAEVRRMKGRVENKPEVVREGARQLKLGPGGLRDIEFAVQLLQMVHGRADPQLRHTGTVPALQALAEGGYVAEDDAETLLRSYRRLRDIEHRLQLARERRTHTLPDDPERLEWLARSLGFRPDAEQPARARFEAALRELQRDVRDLHAKLFYRPLLESHAAVPAASAHVALPHRVRQIGEEAAAERLQALGFRDARGALRHLTALTAGVNRRARALRAALPAMLAVLQDAPEPDTGLLTLRRLVERHSETMPLLGRLRDHPPTAELLARALGASEVVGDLLLSHPQGAQWLEADLGEAVRDRDQLVAQARGRLRWQDPTAALRRFKRHELLRIALRDLAGVAGPLDVGVELSALGDACLEAALTATLEQYRDAHGEPPAQLAVIGMGRLGGYELHYVSDLDVLFVHEPVGDADPDDATAAALEIAERTMAMLSAFTPEGTAFEVDADLRPEGRSGPLSRSLSAYAAYYERWSQPWEHQALLKARPAAGSVGLASRFMDLARPLAFPDDFDEARTQRMRKMKARIERERLGRRVDPRRHLKLGPGGLSDVEWTVQLLQQRHGYRVPEVRVTSTSEALDGMEDAGLVDTRDATWLRDGYRLLGRLRNALYLARIRNVDVLPSAADVLERLARRLGYGAGGGQELEDDYLRRTRRVRQVTERVFYEAAAGSLSRASDWGGGWSARR